MTEYRDPVVADALRRVDLPGPGPGFWTDLEAHLADVGTDVGRDAPTSSTGLPERAEVVELHAPRPGRRPRRVPRVAVAAAVVLAVVGGVALLRDDGGGRALDVTDGTGEPATTVARTAIPGAAADAEAAAVRWLGSLGAGDVSAAYDQLDAGSQQALPRDEFGGFASGLAEGAAAFRDLPADVVSLDLLGRPAHVVTLAGQVTREGSVGIDAYPVVVVEEGGEPRIALEVGALQVESSGSTAVDVTAPPGATVWAWTDSRDPSSVDVDAAGRGSVEQVSGGAGVHVLTVVAVTDGRPVARALVTGIGPLDAVPLSLQPADSFGDATVLEESVDDVDAYAVRAATGGDDRVCFEVELVGGNFGGPCLESPLGVIVAPDGSRYVVGRVTEPAAQEAVVVVDGEEHRVRLVPVPGSGASSFALRTAGEVEDLRLLDASGSELPSVG